MSIRIVDFDGHVLSSGNAASMVAEIGDLLIVTASGITAVPAGNTNSVLTIVAGVPTWV
jgi:hypothetical protein